MARTKRCKDDDPFPSSLRYLLFLGFLIACTGCSNGDDPQTVALIEKYVSPRGITTEKR